MASQFETDVLAEFAALNTAVITLLKRHALAHPNGRDKALSDLLDSGIQALETTNYWSIAPEQRDAFLENAKARYTDIVSSAAKG